jgi:alkyl sulfatase BDS1-like metallo-beta-lactamase superfamily hydrolase
LTIAEATATALNRNDEHRLRNPILVVVHPHIHADHYGL